MILDFNEKQIYPLILQISNKINSLSIFKQQKEKKTSNEKKLNIFFIDSYMSFLFFTYYETEFVLAKYQNQVLKKIIA